MSVLPNQQDFTIIWTKQTQPPNEGQNTSTGSLQQQNLQQRGKKTTRRKAAQDQDEPLLIDTTTKLALRSKKTERLECRQRKKESKEVKSNLKCFLHLPTDLPTEVLSFFLPSEIFVLRRLNQFSGRFIDDNERAIASRIIQRRYWVLSQCFQLPELLSAVPPASQQVLMLDSWQERLKIHKNGYHHIPLINPKLVCTCMSCVLAWNNLNVILDLSDWQGHLDNRQPLPVIPRGRMPEWNIELLERHASIVQTAMKSQICYARILQAHLRSIAHTIVRNSQWQKKSNRA